MSESRDHRSPYAARVELVANVLQVEGLVGLREVEAHACLQQDGPNELPAQQKRNLLAIVLEVVREPMFLMLVAAGVVYLLLGEPTDALMLLGFVFVVMTITIVQARRTEHALEALRDLSSPRALVIRDGQRRRIAGREVVAGDLVVLAEGDRVPADGLLRQALHLATDESLLTGESVPVRKTPCADARALDRPGGDDLSSVFSGTLVTSGQGISTPRFRLVPARAEALASRRHRNDDQRPPKNLGRRLGCDGLLRGRTSRGGAGGAAPAGDRRERRPRPCAARRVRRSHVETNFRMRWTFAPEPTRRRALPSALRQSLVSSLSQVQIALFCRATQRPASRHRGPAHVARTSRARRRCCSTSRSGSAYVRPPVARVRSTG